MCALCPRIIKVRKLERFITQRSIPVWVLPSRIGCFGPGKGYILTDIVEIYPAFTTGSDVHYRMLATMALVTFLLKCCVMTQQEGIMQDDIRLWELICASCQSMAHIAIYVNLLQKPYILNRYIFQITTINLLNERYYCQVMSS